MPFLFPQLLAEIGRRSAVELSTMTVEEASRRADERSQDPASISVFSATGGTPVTAQQLSELRNAVMAIARGHGFPVQSRRGYLACDAQISVIVRERMNMTPHEAASAGIWEYLACVLMPDVAVWRFRAASKTSEDHFLAGRRNTFQRLWWRAHVLAGHLGTDEAVKLLAFLTEDDMVATMERPGLFGNLRIVRIYYAEFRKAVEGGQLGVPREAVNRDVHKRLLRVIAVRALDALPDEALKIELQGLIAQAAVHMKQAAAPLRTVT